MSTCAFTPLRDCTHNVNQRQNIQCQKPGNGVVVSVRQHNPYEVKVVPTDEEEAMMIRAQALAYEQSLLAMLMQAACSMSMSPNSPTNSAMTDASFGPTSPTSEYPSPQSLTKVYREGRPVPTLKSPTKPSTPLKGDYIVTCAFRHTSADFFLERAEAFFGSEEEAVNSYVIVDGDRGIDLGRVMKIRSTESMDPNTFPTLEVQRCATNDEIERYHSLVDDEAKATAMTISQCTKLGLQKLQVIDTTFQFDKQKLTIRYRASERIYFVPLLKALNSVYKCRIWMEKLE